MKKLKLITNIEESYNELRYKTSWPTRSQLVKSSIIVLVASAIIAVIIFLIDYVFQMLTQFVYPSVG